MTHGVYVEANVINPEHFIIYNVLSIELSIQDLPKLAEIWDLTAIIV